MASKVIKLPTALKYVELHQIYEDDIYRIGIGKSDPDGETILQIRVKPEGVHWHYNLENDFDAALARWEEYGF